MTCAEALSILADPLPIWAWVAIVALPFAVLAVTACYYRLRYRWGIEQQREFAKGLRK